jgi:hypothetical protein
MTLSESQQFQQRARLAKPPGVRGNGHAVDMYIEAAEQPDSHVLWRHAFSVSPRGDRPNVADGSWDVGGLHRERHPADRLDDLRLAL